MPITVYTYHDPYKLKENTNLWKEISSCPYFCVSQTLVNGLKSVYGSSFQIGRVTTVMNLTSALLRFRIINPESFNCHGFHYLWL